jgi:hypothetical protein
MPWSIPPRATKNRKALLYAGHFLLGWQDAFPHSIPLWMMI